MEQNQNEEFYPEFYMTPRILWADKAISPMAEKVFSVIYWYGKLKDGYCHASNATIAKNIGSTNAASVSRAIAKLIDNGYVTAEYEPTTGERLALVPLVHLAKGGIPNGKGPLYQMVEHNKNNIEKNNYIVDFTKNYSEMSELHKLYVSWLIGMVIGNRKWLATENADRRSLLESAAKQTKLTPKRIQKVSVRISELGFEACRKAILAIGNSAWHQGENDNKWKASLEWLFHSTERTEEWSNKK